MWNYNKPNFKTILDYVTTNPYQAYMIELTNRKDTFSLHICLENAYLTYPFQFVITIYDINHNKQARCDFFIYSDFCEIVNIDSDLKGLGSIMFHIIEDMIKEIEIKQHISINKIIGSLSYTHKDLGAWLQSIPFYCMKAYEYGYRISFQFHSENHIFEANNVNNISHDEMYTKALNFAHKFVSEAASGSFIIYRN